MPLVSEDEYQKNVSSRNNALALLLQGAWAGDSIVGIKRVPDDEDDNRGKWVAETG